MTRHFKRSYYCAIVRFLDSSNSNSSSCSIDLFVYEKLLSEFQLGRPCGCSIDISLIRAVSRKIVRRSRQGSHNPRLSWQRTRTKKETSLEAIGQEKYKVTLPTGQVGKDLMRGFVNLNKMKRNSSRVFSRVSLKLGIFQDSCCS